MRNMVSDPVNERMKEAGAYLDEAEKLGDIPETLPAFIACDGILDNIKIFIHNEKAWEEINRKEQELNTMFKKEFKEKIEKIKHEDEYMRFLKMRKIEIQIMRWKCKQRLGFYDFLTKKYDI